MSKSIVKKFVDFAMGNGIALILGFLSTPIISRLISPEEMGKFSNFNTITSLLCLVLLFGLDQAFVRYYYEEKEESRKRLLFECIKIPIIICAGVGVLILLAYKPISTYIIGEDSFNIAFILVIHTFFSILNTFSLLVIRMQQRGKLYSMMQIVIKATYIIFLLSLYKVYGDDNITVILAYVLANILVVILAITIERKEWRLWDNEYDISNSKRSLIKYGLPLVFSASIVWVFQSIDRIFLNVYCNKAEVGLYSMAFTIIALLNAVQGAFTTFWVPIANENYNKNPENTEFFSKINKYITVIMSFLGIGLIAGKDIIVFLLGAEYRQAVFIIPFLVFMPIMYTISEVTVVGISFKKETKYHIVIAVVSAIVNVVGNYILVPRLGAIGAALSTGVSYIVFYMIRTFISYKLYKVNYNIKRFLVLIVAMLVLAIYSTLNTLNLGIVIITLINLGILYLLYKSTVDEIISNVIAFIKKK